MPYITTYCNSPFKGSPLLEMNDMDRGFLFKKLFVPLPIRCSEFLGSGQSVLKEKQMKKHLSAYTL